jgi:hypothetical protein
MKIPDFCGTPQPQAGRLDETANIWSIPHIPARPLGASFPVREMETGSQLIFSGPD